MKKIAKREPETAKLSARVDADLVARLKSVCALKRVRMQDAVAEAVAAWLPPEPRTRRAR